jgi:hypothetical protein
MDSLDDLGAFKNEKEKNFQKEKSALNFII